MREPMLDESMYRIIQESLNNAVKHAHTQNVSIQIEYDTSNMICFSITDDGMGFDPDAIETADSRQGNGMGMKTMRERAESLGGSLRIESAPGAGTTIKVLIPLKEVLK